MSRSPGRAPGRILLLFVCLFLNSCKNDPAQPDLAGSLHLEFGHVVGDSLLEVNSHWFKNAFGNDYRVRGLRYYVSKVGLRGPDGTYIADIAHLVDVQRPETLALHVGGIPEGHYHELVFTFGLDPEWNQTGRLPAEPQHLEMVWPNTWGGGYHYMQLEGEFLDAMGQPAHFRTHTGALRMAGEEHHHHFSVALVAHLTIVRRETRHAQILMDVNEWYTAPHDIDLETHVNGIMDNTAAQDLLQANGADVFRLGSADSSPPPKLR